jgi:hypothetical protein
MVLFIIQILSGDNHLCQNILNTLIEKKIVILKKMSLYETDHSTEYTMEDLEDQFFQIEKEMDLHMYSLSDIQNSQNAF